MVRVRRVEYTEVEIPVDEPIYTSGVVCRLLGIPVWILKQLDREKLVSPTRQRGGGRLYSALELKRLGYLWFLIDKRGVNVQGLRVILEMKEVVSGKPAQKSTFKKQNK